MTGDQGWLPELFAADVWPRLGAHFGLTARQVDVARLMCRGLPNKQIATELGRSVNTVAMHQRMLFRRLAVHDRVGVVVRLVQAERALRETAERTHAGELARGRAVLPDRPPVTLHVAPRCPAP
jgi:DNA-binding CsgD family transcriptional regulator